MNDVMTSNNQQGLNQLSDEPFSPLIYNKPSAAYLRLHQYFIASSYVYKGSIGIEMLQYDQKNINRLQQLRQEELQKEKQKVQEVLDGIATPEKGQPMLIDYKVWQQVLQKRLRDQRKAIKENDLKFAQKQQELRVKQVREIEERRSNQENIMKTLISSAKKAKSQRVSPKSKTSRKRLKLSELIKKFNVKTDEGMQAALEQSVRYKIIKDLVRESNSGNDNESVQMFKLNSPSQSKRSYIIKSKFKMNFQTQYFSGVQSQPFIEADRLNEDQHTPFKPLSSIKNKKTQENFFQFKPHLLSNNTQQNFLTPIKQKQSFLSVNNANGNNVNTAIKLQDQQFNDQKLITPNTNHILIRHQSSKSLSHQKLGTASLQTYNNLNYLLYNVMIHEPYNQLLLYLKYLNYLFSIQIYRLNNCHNNLQQNQYAYQITSGSKQSNQNLNSLQINTQDFSYRLALKHKINFKKQKMQFNIYIYIFIYITIQLEPIIIRVIFWIKPNNNFDKKIILDIYIMQQEMEDYQKFLLDKLEPRISERNHEMFQAQLKKIKKDIESEYENYKNQQRLKKKIYYPYTILDQLKRDALML